MSHVSCPREHSLFRLQDGATLAPPPSLLDDRAHIQFAAECPSVRAILGSGTRSALRVSKYKNGLRSTHCPPRFLRLPASVEARQCRNSSQGPAVCQCESPVRVRTSTGGIDAMAQARDQFIRSRDLTSRPQADRFSGLVASSSAAQDRASSNVRMTGPSSRSGLSLGKQPLSLSPPCAIAPDRWESHGLAIAAGCSTRIPHSMFSERWIAVNRSDAQAAAGLGGIG